MPSSSPFPSERSPDDSSSPRHSPLPFTPEVDSAINVFCELDHWSPNFEGLSRALGRLKGPTTEDFLQKLLEIPVTRVDFARPGHIDGLIYVANFFLDFGVTPEKVTPLYKRAQSAAANSLEHNKQAISIFGEVRCLTETDSLEQRVCLAKEALQIIKQNDLPITVTLASAALPPLTFLIESLRNECDLHGAQEFADATLKMVGALSTQNSYDLVTSCWRLIDYYAAVGDGDSVCQSFREAQRISDFWVDNCYLPWAGVLLAYGNYLISAGQAESALPFLRISVGHFKREKAEGSMLDAVQSVIEALQALGRNDEAMILAREHNLE